MSLRTGIELAKALKPRRSFNFSNQETTMNQTTSQERGSRWAKRATVTLGGTIAVTLGAGVAIAAWSSNGVGTASAKAGAALGVTAGTATPSSTLLYPGVSVPLAVTINNPNPYPVKVTGIVLAAQTAPTGVSGALNATTCTAAASLVTTSAVNVTGTNLVSIAANSTATYTTATNVVSMGLNADDGCQNATFTFADATVTAASG